MTQEHPIIPPLELVQQWCHEDGDEIKTSPRWYQIVAAKAARWAADLELDACCEWVSQFDYGDCSYRERLRAARRPKPPSLKEQALAVLDSNKTRFAVADEDTIRRALESLPE